MSLAAGVLQPRARCTWHALGRRKDCFQGGVNKLSFVSLDSTGSGAACSPEQYLLLQKVWPDPWCCDPNQDIFTVWSAATASD